MTSQVVTAPRRAGMVALLRPTVTITLLTLGAQAVAFLTQVVIAASFGARADMDAFLAASTLPQYLIAVLLSVLAFVFIPVFVEYAAAGREDDAWDIASAVLTMCAVVLGALSLLGIAFARPLLRYTTPGLTPGSLDLAVRVAYHYPEFSPAGPPKDTIALNEAYITQAAAAMDQRLTTAGARLAMLLNGILGR